MFSQLCQDKYLNDNIFKNFKDGFFVDVGAHNGISFSNTYFFEKNLNWKGICIEANPIVYKQLQKNRENSINLNIAIDIKDSECTFLVNHGYTEMLSGIKEYYDIRHLERIKSEQEQYGGYSEEIKIESLKLESIFNKYDIKHVHYLSIDIEGGEKMCIESIDFNNIFIDIINFENNYPEIGIEIIYFLKNKGYELLDFEDKQDIMMINKKSQFYNPTNILGLKI